MGSVLSRKFCKIEKKNIRDRGEIVEEALAWNKGISGQSTDSTRLLKS
jgi:hypothetical protein